MSQIVNNKFLEVALSQVPRLLGQLNRNPGSKSYGSFDRAYWHYRTNDISSCRYQEAAYTLTLLYVHGFEGNCYHNDEKVLEWVRAALRFTSSIQRPNGSFDEWYINEGSYVGTAFLISALCQVLILLHEQGIDLPEEKLITRVISRAAEFLLGSSEVTVLNQVSGAIFALAAASKVTGNAKFRDKADSLLTHFLSLQNNEGWWSEYGGPDIGYLSLTISYLGKCRELTESHEADDAIVRAIKFLEQFINPDGTAGGEYMARNTEYLIPSRDLPYLSVINPSNLDDRYLCYVLYNWVETGLAIAPHALETLPGEQYFSESKLLRSVNDRYQLFIGSAKGASLRIYSGGKAYYDSGLEIKTGRVTLFTGALDQGNITRFKSGELHVTGSGKPIKEPLMSTPTVILFKKLQLIFGRLSIYQKAIKKFLRPQMISYSGSSPIKFERVIKYSEKEIEITDVLIGEVNESDVRWGSKAAYTAVPSSKYFVPQELTHNILIPQTNVSSEPNKITLTRTFKF
ncbi:MAG TPA: hypothetical protein VJB98_03700 [Candidatus Paceibacterota bacterium]